MTNIIVLTTVVVCVMGVGVFAWSMLDTRKKFYNDFMEKHRK